jgi:DNA-binding GntR family transcriptional regulator
LRQICDRFRLWVEKQDVTQCLKKGIKFHEEMVRISDYNRLREIMQTFVLTNPFSIAGRWGKNL